MFQLNIILDNLKKEIAACGYQGMCLKDVPKHLQTMIDPDCAHYTVEKDILNQAWEKMHADTKIRLIVVESDLSAMEQSLRKQFVSEMKEGGRKQNETGVDHALFFNIFSHCTRSELWTPPSRLMWRFPQHTACPSMSWSAITAQMFALWPMQRAKSDKCLQI
ncbi:hypothetical protein BC940DRAFT_297865 [Gongronella butleri]|nr:hypothetical protein BC940DRAFT_297865 [Gongronella butleri]